MSVFLTQGAFAGVLLSLGYNLWMWVGKLLQEGGEPPQLPFSVDSCPALGNATLEVLPSVTPIVTSVASNITTLEQSVARPVSFFIHSLRLHSFQSLIVFISASILFFTFFPDRSVKEKSIYDISYCYNGLIAILITMVVSGFVALLAGKLHSTYIQHLKYNIPQTT